MKEKFTFEAEALYHGHNHPMLYVNLYDKNYLCISKSHFQIEDKKISETIYVGEQWVNVAFPENQPIAIYKDFFEFIKQGTKEFGSIKQLFHTTKANGLKIYMDHVDSAPFILYSLLQVDQTFNLGDELVSTILKKTNENFWIWESVKLNLSLDLYRKFKKQIGSIPKTDLLLAKDDVLKLPFEYVLLLYRKDRVSLNVLTRKFDTLKGHLFSLSIANFTRKGIEVLLNDSRVLLTLRGIDIERHFDVISLIEKDQFLNRLFIQRLEYSDIDWIIANVAQIKATLKILKEYDLDTHDPFPEEEEFNVLCKLFIEKSEYSLVDILGPDGFNLHEFKFFSEYRNKVNTSLIKHLSPIRLSLA